MTEHALNLIMYATPALISGLIWLLLAMNTLANSKLKSFFRNMFGILLGPTFFFFGYVEFVEFFIKDDNSIAFGSLFLLVGLGAFIFLYGLSYLYFRHVSLAKHLLFANVIAFVIIVPFFPWSHILENVNDIFFPSAAWLAICSSCSLIHWFINQLSIEQVT